MNRPRPFRPLPTPTRPRRTRLWVESLEGREVPAGLFIQGQAYTDTNGNGVFDPGELPLAGATVKLLDSVGNPIPGVAIKTVDPTTGMFRFTDADFPIATYPNGMPSGTYQVVETPPSGYVNTGADASHWNLGAHDSPNSSTVTVAVSAQSVTMQSWTLGNYETVSPITFPDMSVDPPDPNAQWSVDAGELLLTLSGGSFDPSQPVLAYCVDFNSVLEDAASVIPLTASPPSGPTLDPNGNAIAYLYNRFGVYGFTTLSPALAQLYSAYNAAHPSDPPLTFNPNQDAAAFQIALWELSHDGGNVSLENADFAYPSATADPALYAKANAFLAAAAAAPAGELVLYLNGLAATPSTQWLVIGGMVTFGNATPGIHITKQADTTVAAPYQPVTYTYQVTNPSGVPLDNVVVKDDNGTPNYAGDDFNPAPVLGNGTTPADGSHNIGDYDNDNKLDPTETWLYSATVIPPVTTTSVVNGNTVTAGVQIITTVLGNGNIRVTYLQSFNINDNTYGTGAIGWPNGHKFGDLTGSDKLEFRFYDKSGNVPIDFYVDTITQATG